MAARPIAWAPVMSAMLAGAALAGILAWRLNLQGLEAEISGRRAALKKLTLSGNIPPNQDVMEHLNVRQRALEDRYGHWVEAVSVPPPPAAAAADPQLYFQEQFHQAQRMVERAAAARAMAAPEWLGFPKEIPPADTVPRLLAQLSLIHEAGALLLEQGVAALSSLKVEDPESVPEEKGEGAFLSRLPVRVRLSCSLAQFAKILAAIERARPRIDVRAVHIVAVEAQESLDVELVLARYLIANAPASEALPATNGEEEGSAAIQRNGKPTKAKKARSVPP